MLTIIKFLAFIEHPALIYHVLWLLAEVKNRVINNRFL